MDSYLTYVYRFWQIFSVAISIQLIKWSIQRLREQPLRADAYEIIELYEKAERYSLDRIMRRIRIYSNRPNYNQMFNYKGLYVMYNRTTNKYFVGADVHVLDGLAWHISGEGFENVYADIQNNHDWEVRIIPITLTKHTSIEPMWYAGLKAFDANRRKNGYN